MLTKAKLKEDLIAALKEKNALEVSVLRQLLAAILNKEKEKKYKMKEEGETELTDREALEVIFSEAKKRKESIFSFEKGQRKDLVEKEKKELEILEKYLPEQMSEEEIKKLAEEAIEKTNAREAKEMGKIMAELMPKIKGRAEGSLVSKVVKELLAQTQ